MTKKTRWIIFCAAVIIFLCLSYAMVVFSLGYKYDFSENSLVRTGSFRVVANAKADVYINGKLAGETSFIGNSFSKGRLLPRTYEVRLEKEKYFPWKKSVRVSAGFFVDFPKIVLVPSSLEEIKIATLSFGFPAQENSLRVYDGKILSFDEHEVFVEWTDKTNFQPFRQSGETETILRLSSRIDDVQWYGDGEHIFVLSGGVISFREIDIRGGANSYDIASTDGPFFYDRRENMFYILKNGEIFGVKFD